MIIKALSDYYYSLLEKGKDIPVSGWCYEKVSYALLITDEGKLAEVVSLFEKETDANGKSKIIPSKILVPEHPGCTSGIRPCFLCYKSSYMLGIDNPPDKKDSARFAACRELHHHILDGTNAPEAAAVLKFLDSWNPEKAHEHQALKDCFDDVCAAGNLIFMYHGKYITDYESIKSAWDNRETADESGLCMVSGKHCNVARLHTHIKGIGKAHSSGAALVCFNTDSVESYGKHNSQALNAPISKDIMFAYTTALSYMLANKEHHIVSFDDLTIFYWAKSAEDEYSDFMCAITSPSSKFNESEALRAISNLSKGYPADISVIVLAPDEEFYILGITSNVSLLSVRFFLKSTFGNFVKNVDEHYKRLDIVPSFVNKKMLSINDIVLETVHNKKENKPDPTLTSAVLKAVFNNTAYPASLFFSVIKRLKADHQITRSRAAIIKAYLIKNSTNKKLKEALTLELNDECKYTPYLLGRAFAVCEKIQKSTFEDKDKANKSDDEQERDTIKDKYFDSACATPALVFPQILKLKNYHIKSLKSEYPGLAIYYEKTLSEILSSVDSGFPKSLNMEEQGVFILGYYHQTQKFYAKKEEE